MVEESMEKMFIDFLKENLKKSRKFQFEDWKRHVTDVIGKKPMYENMVEGVEVLSEFLLKNIIAIGGDWSNYSFGWFRITEYGVKFLEEN